MLHKISFSKFNFVLYKYFFGFQIQNLFRWLFFKSPSCCCSCSYGCRLRKKQCFDLMLKQKQTNKQKYTHTSWWFFLFPFVKYLGHTMILYYLFSSFNNIYWNWIVLKLNFYCHVKMFFIGLNYFCITYGTQWWLFFWI